MHLEPPALVSRLASQAHSPTPGSQDFLYMLYVGFGFYVLGFYAFLAPMRNQWTGGFFRSLEVLAETRRGAISAQLVSRVFIPCILLYTTTIQIILLLHYTTLYSTTADYRGFRRSSCQAESKQ